MVWNKTLNEKSYIDSLLRFLTEKEIRQLRIIFPNLNKDKDKVISLIERHLLSHVDYRKKNEKLSDECKSKEEEIDCLKKDLSLCRKTQQDLSDENMQLNKEIDILQAKVDLDSVEVVRRLAILNALEAGGVDNWQWYEESLKNAGL